MQSIWLVITSLRGGVRCPPSDRSDPAEDSIRALSGFQIVSMGQESTIVLGFCLMARPYGDPVEIVTAPIPAQSPFIPADAKIVVGAVAPASPDPIPIVLLPGFEYRMLEWRHPTTHEIHWRLERRKSAQYGERRRITSPTPIRGL